MAFSSDGSIFASASRENIITLLDTVTTGRVQTLVGHEGKIICLAISSDGSLLASGSLDNNVKIWKIAKNVCIQTLEGHTGGIISVKFSPDCQRLASASTDLTIRIWDLATTSSLVLKHPSYKPPTSIDFSGNGEILVSSSSYGTIKMWNTISGDCMQTWQHPKDNGDMFKSLTTTISPDGKTIASSSASCLKMWSDIDGKYECVQTLTHYHEYATKVVFSPDGRQLVSSSSAADTTDVWSFEDPPGSAAICRTFKSDKSSFLTSAFSEIGSPVASELCLYGLDTTERWVTRNGHKILRLPDDIRPKITHGFAFMVHGRIVAILSASRRLIILTF
ncbi:hypothetical protein THAR02_04135 [Trichoderma harzianum]|uniref:Uncharacterized protein n=1 Tax=Trichoderma harzianum TaxID=5544 RepID=A0A0F9ZU64_TRIHA|nr:hypothetical protein THAR02_04135 [Trichoderma harzianum]